MANSNLKGGVSVTGGTTTDTLTVLDGASLQGSLSAGATTVSSLTDSGGANIAGAVSTGGLTVNGNELITGNLTVDGTISPWPTGLGSSPGGGGDTITNLQMIWGTFQDPNPAGGGFSAPFARFAGWILLITTAQGRQFSINVSDSAYPTVPYDITSHQAPMFPPNRYLYYPADVGVSGSNAYLVEIMPDSSFNNYHDSATGGLSWTLEYQGAAGTANNNPNRPWGTGNPPYDTWPHFLFTGEEPIT